MLQLDNVCKQYQTGNLIQKALDQVTLNLRQNEFVSILGPSGSGKTTLLNIIGGLDRYDSGDIVINGTSTRSYQDRDWDTYRNHTIGFVFQSYNLIPHQSILANVELALTIGGISRKDRQQRAREALEAVGLGDQCHKKPNQMSGGQMQRVAIARALVNDPDILLADEPTGALDTETSIQVMELLKKVAKDRLVIMVTHNSELAEEYSTRIVKLRDGKIISDSNPYLTDNEQPQSRESRGMAKMNFSTALSLSFNNLLTKKGRTLLTAFAGSIGIIGIALILALSTGVNNYIANIQKDTMTSYPITLNAQTLNASGMLQLRDQFVVEQLTPTEKPSLNGIYADTSSLETQRVFSANTVENDLTAFKKYLEDPSSQISNHIGENGIIYTYDVSFSVYARDKVGNLINTDRNLSRGSSLPGFGSMTSLMSMSGGTNSGTSNFSELMPGTDGQAVSSVTTDSYEILYGHWPESYNEVVLVLDNNNAVDLDTLCQLGLITDEEYLTIVSSFRENSESDPLHLDYTQACGHQFYLIPACANYINESDGTFALIETDWDELPDSHIELTITGIVRPISNAPNANISTAIGYTSALTHHVISYTDASAVVLAQEATPLVNVLTGIDFEAADDAEKIRNISDYIHAMAEDEKTALFSKLQSKGIGYSGPISTNAVTMDQWLLEDPNEDILLALYEEYLADASFTANMKAFGKVSYDAPSSISIYSDSFEDKEAIAEAIKRYNDSVTEDSRITYVDYVQLMTASLTSIIDVISYVLIAFVAVSLVVSCIMIGIITHISVMEHTKEIGILRALGASKRNISQVFNAETVIIGLCAGLLGVGITMALTVSINTLLSNLLDVDMAAQLPFISAVVLVIVSIVITVIGGLIPASKAAKMDPVKALRTE